VNNPRQAPESAEIRAQEEVRTQDEEARADRGPGDEPIQEALETAAEVAEKTGGLGEPGRPVNRRSPFMIGLYAAFGVAVAYGLIQLFIHARSVLILIGLAFFIAAGLDPIVGWLVRHGMPRWAAVLVVIVGGLGIVAGFLAAAIRRWPTRPARSPTRSRTTCTICRTATRSLASSTSSTTSRTG
jgi:hypothetical protein